MLRDSSQECLAHVIGYLFAIIITFLVLCPKKNHKKQTNKKTKTPDCTSEHLFVCFCLDFPLASHCPGLPSYLLHHLLSPMLGCGSGPSPQLAHPQTPPLILRHGLSCTICAVQAPIPIWLLRA